MSARDLEDVARIAIDLGFRLHERLGPGLLESAYEALLQAGLERAGLAVERQKALDLTFEGVSVREAFRLDILVERRLIIEVKSVERLQAVHAKQLLTYLRLTDLRLGLLMNFGGGTFREGLRRVVNGYDGGFATGERRDF